MASSDLNIVTGAFSYTGKYLTRRLLALGKMVRTLTNHPPQGPNPFGERVEIAPLDFTDPDALTNRLRGASVLYNTYWVRFAHGPVTYEGAVENTQTLIRAAKDAGVGRIVHISITNASEGSPLPYFRGKGILERAVRESGLSYAIVRPTVIFGTEGILINNIAWFLRHFPAFAVPGPGEYRIQPIYVEDLAAIMASAGQRTDNIEIDAVGPETYTFTDLVRLIKTTIGSRALIAHLPPGVARAMSAVIGYLVRDVVLTRDEVAGLTDNLLVSSAPPTGDTRLSDWLARNSSAVGRSYASELQRHFR